jgi:hypothetical protein
VVAHRAVARGIWNVNVLIIFADFNQLSAKNLASFSKINVHINPFKA